MKDVYNVFCNWLQQSYHLDFCRNYIMLCIRHDGWNPGPIKVDGKTPAGSNGAWIYPHKLNSEQTFLASDKRGTSILSVITVSTFGSAVMSIPVRCQHTSRNRNIDATGSRGNPLPWDLVMQYSQVKIASDLREVGYEKTLIGFKFLVCSFWRSCNFDFTEAVPKTFFTKLEDGCAPWSKLY